MATINVKEESSTPDSLSDYETKTHDKRLSLAEELDATQNELKEAEDKLTAAIQQVRQTTLTFGGPEKGRLLFFVSGPLVCYNSSADYW